MVKLFLVKCSNKRICCVNNNPKAVNSFLTIQTKTWIWQCFFVDCPKIPFWSVLSLNCCRLFKIYRSYIISKCRSVKIINIPWFLVPKNQWKTNACPQNQYFPECHYAHTLWAERYTCLLVKKIAFMSSTQKWLFHSAYFCDWGTKKDVFCGIHFCDVDILWKKCRIYFCNPNILTKFIQRSLKSSIYGNNLCLS